MRHLRFGTLRIELMALAVLTATWFAAPALAHKMVVFATGADRAIEGEAYFHGGEPARDVKVTLLGPGDRVLGETTTDQEGKFRFAIQFRCDYRVIADAGAGHGAEYSVPADELSGDLPEAGAGDRPGGKPSEPAAFPVPEDQAAATPVEAHDEPVAAPHADRGNADVEAIRRQVAALRSDFNRFRNELRLGDVLGGLGYILGIMGTAFYFLGVRRKEKRAA